MGNTGTKHSVNMTESVLLDAKELSRLYGSHRAVDCVSFQIKKGEVLGFLGPNGAGKSTTMKMLSGCLAPTQGQICIAGFDLFTQPRKAKKQIGYLPEQPPLYKELTVQEFLIFCARLHMLPTHQIRPAVEQVIARCGLQAVTQRLIGNLSKGYQQRVGIAQAIIHTPAVVILDEPTSGLDPMQIREIRQLIRDIADEHSVILSTHILPEVQTLCDRVQIINHGKLVFSGDLEYLNQQMQRTTLLLECLSPPDIATLGQIEQVQRVEQLSPHRFRIHFIPEHNPSDAIVELAARERWQLRQLTPEQHSLEEIFMHVIQQEQTIP